MNSPIHQITPSQEPEPQRGSVSQPGVAQRSGATPGNSHDIPTTLKGLRPFAASSRALLRPNHSANRLASWVAAFLFTLFLSLAPLSATSARDLFAQANDALARRDAKTAIDAYTKIANSSGTSPALADNIIAAAELASEPGLAEWARRTALLRRTEWWLILAGFSAAAWAAAVAFGVWKRWTWKKHATSAILGAAGIAAGLYCAHRWMPPAGEAVVIHATQKSAGAIPAADVLLSPFSGAEVVGSLQPGTHVVLAPPDHSSSTQPPENFLRIRDPQSDLTGWVRADDVRETGK